VNKLLSLLSPSLVGSGMACVGDEKMGDEAPGSVNSGPFIHLRCQYN
jgi:hypothetical protein